MALPFDRSIRALRSDREGLALTALALTILLLVLWAIWFLFAPIPRFEAGQVIGINRNGALIAIFPQQSRLQPGQLAQVRAGLEQEAPPPYSTILGAGTAVEGSSTLPILAMVMLVEQDYRNNQLTAELTTLSDPSLLRGEGILQSLAQVVESGQSPVVVEVEVEQVSPAQLLLRASGQWMGGRVPVSMRTGRLRP